MKNTSRQSLREYYLQKRQTLLKSYQQNAARTICARIETLDFYHDAQKICFYRAFKGEINLSLLYQSALNNKKQCYFPVVSNTSTLIFLPTNKATIWQLNKFGIAEPLVHHNDAISPEQIDLMLIPLLAFDKHGTRLGMGAGFYDKTLEKSKPKLLMGAAYDFQKQEYMEPMPWDVPLDMIITEKNIYTV